MPSSAYQVLSKKLIIISRIILTALTIMPRIWVKWIFNELFQGGGPSQQAVSNPSHKSGKV